MPAVEDLRELLEKQRLALERSEPGVLDGTDPENCTDSALRRAGAAH